ncbi:hypothetical protein ABK040_001572 [Willaertia magna]
MSLHNDEPMIVDVVEDTTIPQPNLTIHSGNGVTNSNNNNIQQEQNVEENKNKEEVEDNHTVYINDWDKNKLERKKWYLFKNYFGISIPRFPSNYVSTTKYTWWNFIFLNLLYQMKKIGNIYFIVVMIFSLIPGVSPIFPITSILPVIFILGVNMIREGGEDFLRYLNDRKINKMDAFVLREGKIQRVDTSDVKVGDIVKVDEDFTFPADILLISSSFEDGSCKIETANLDGETNLKPRYCPNTSMFNSTDRLMKMKGGVIKCQLPNEQLYKFKGSIQYPNIESNNELVEKSLSHMNILLKGSILKATDYIYGVVIYTGKDTKIMRNMHKGKVKFSYVNYMLNYFIGMLFIIQFLACCILVGIGAYHEFTTRRKSFYIPPPTPKGVTDAGFVVMSWLTYFILLNMLIPVSLFVSLEFVKMIQAWFITMDNRMAITENDPHDPDRKMFIHSESISTDLNADLSQIDIIFSDKTGTLTENSMVFNKLYVLSNNSDYLHDDYKIKGNLGTLLKEYMNSNTKQSPTENRTSFSSMKGKITNDDEFFAVFQSCLCLSLCHNVSIREKKVKHKKDIELEELPADKSTNFEGESVDEVALVLGANNNDFQLVFYSELKTTLRIFGKEYTFERLCEIPFSPDRKRMSTMFMVPNNFLQDFPIVKEKIMRSMQVSSSTTPNSNVVICFCKGADSFLFPYIKDDNRNQYKKQVDANILDMAKDGLRTLLLAYKYVDEVTFKKWLSEYDQAKSVLGKQRETLVEKSEGEMERDLFMIGATGIEDKLQPHVPETIKFFLTAGLQLWLLTGDKRETAVNIAGMSNFINSESTIYTLDGDGGITSEEECAKALAQHLKSIEELKPASLDNIALVLDGHAFDYCLGEQTAKLFIDLIKKCKTVICCRATPKQKAKLVELAKKKLKKNGLAIGDGANDVPMIQKAKVGVGVMGKEGTQAKLSSDYAIPKFYMLKRLLVVHGRYSYKRSAQFIQYSFYKNMVITLVQIYFSFYCLWSGQTLVDSYVLTFYNMIFTLMNPFVFGLMEKDINEEILEDPETGPKLYASIRKENIFNVYTFIKWVGGGILHGTIIYFFTIYATYDTMLSHSMQHDGIWARSALMCSIVFFVVNIKCYLEMEHLTWVHHACMAFSFFTYYAFNFCYVGIPSVLGTRNMYYVWYEIVKSAQFWIVHILGVASPFVIDLTAYTIKYFVSPDPYQKYKMMARNRTNQVMNQKKDTSCCWVDDHP